MVTTDVCGVIGTVVVVVSSGVVVVVVVGGVAVNVTDGVGVASTVTGPGSGVCCALGEEHPADGRPSAMAVAEIDPCALGVGRQPELGAVDDLAGERRASSLSCSVTPSDGVTVTDAAVVLTTYGPTSPPTSPWSTPAA